MSRAFGETSFADNPMGTCVVNKAQILVLAVCLLTGCQRLSEKACDVDPQIFCEPFAALAAEMPASAKAELLAMPEDEYWKLHFGLGMGVRNRFDLWQDNELTRFFKENGLDHPDSMSTPFIEGYVRYLRGVPVVMRQLVIAHAVPPPPMLPEESSTSE